MYNIHCMNNIAKVGTDRLAEGYRFVDDLDEADAIMVRSANLLELAFPTRLLAIARAGAGVNNIPLKRCAEEGIVVFNTPGANANAVKELVFCGMLLASRDIIGGNEWVRENCDDPDLVRRTEKVKKRFAGVELAGKRLGVIGLGSIGAVVANTATRFGMEALGYDPHLSINAAWGLDRRIRHVTDINEIFRECDYITIHVPATDETRGMIGADAIRQMRRGVVVLNLARDVLVDEQAMAEALDDGLVARYVCDFPDPATANMRNAIVLPHLGASTAEAEDNCAIMAATELKDYLENGTINHSVNYGTVDLGPLSAGRARICLFHQNMQGLIGKISATLTESNLNIENMSNKSCGGSAYTLIEVTGDAADSPVGELSQIRGMRRVRLIPPR